MQQNRALCIMEGVSTEADLARDQELVTRAQKDPEAFGEIFDLYYARILTYALRRTGDAALAEDITAETFVKALEHLPRFVWRGVPLSAWLYKIAGNEIRMHLRKPGAKSQSLELLVEHGFDPTDHQLAEEREHIAAALQADAELRAIMHALRALAPHYQEAITLRYVEGCEVAEIARIMGKREGSVRSLLSRGLALVRATVQQNGDTSITTDEGRSVLQTITHQSL